MGEEPARGKVYFPARLIRGLVNGIVCGGILYCVFDILCRAVNVLAAATVLNPTGYAMLGLGLGIFAGVGIDLTKEIVER